MRRPKILAIAVEDGYRVFVVKYTSMSVQPQHKEKFMCEHCKSENTSPEMDIVQFGFLDDKHQLVVFCKECLQLTVFEYTIGD